MNEFNVVGEALELSEQYTGTGTPDIVTLRHPNTGESAVFLFSPANNSVQEVLTFNENKRSWFIDESVKNDGKMHLSTPIDPIFLGMSNCYRNIGIVCLIVHVYVFSVAVFKKILHNSSSSARSTSTR